MHPDAFLDSVIYDLAVVSAENKKNNWTSWPAEAWHVEHFGAAQQRRIYFDWINELIKKGMTEKEIGKLFVWPARALYLGILAGRKGVRALTKDERTTFAKKTIGIYQTMKRAPYYSVEGKNLILDDAYFSQLVNENKPTAEGDCSLFVKTLHLTLFALVETIYSYRRTNGCEVNGKYSTDAGSFVVMDIFDLDTPFMKSTLKIPFKTLRLVEQVSDDFSVSIDPFQHIHISGNWPQSVQKLFVFADDHLLSENELKELISTLSLSLQEVTQEMTNMEYRQRIETLLKNNFWAYRRIPAALGLSYLPDGSFFESVRKNDFPVDLQPVSQLQQLSQEDLVQILQKKLDPRTD